jgi:hypothetical protein
MPKKVYFTKANLKARGWTEALIREFLGEPDSQTQSQGWGTAAADTWNAISVLKAEASGEFLSALEKSLTRRKAERRLIELFEKNRKIGPTDFENAAFGNAIGHYLEKEKERKQLTLNEELDRELRRSITDWKLQTYSLPSFASLIISNRVLKSSRNQRCREATSEELELYCLHELPLSRKLLFADWNGARVMSYDANKDETSILPNNGTYLLQFPRYPNLVFSDSGNGFNAFPSRTTLAGRFDMQYLTRAEYERRLTKPLSKRELRSLISLPEFSRLNEIVSRAWYPDRLRANQAETYWKLIHGTLLLGAIRAGDDLHELFLEKVKQSVEYQAKKKREPFYQELWNSLFA